MRIQRIDDIKNYNKISDSVAIYGFFTGDRAIIERKCGKVSARDVFENADLSDIDELKRSILSYETIPAVLLSSRGVAFVIPSFAWSSGLFAAYVPSVSKKAVEVAISEGMLGDVKVIGGGVRRVRGDDALRAQAELLSEWLCDIKECYSAVDIKSVENIADFVRVRAERIANHIGVRVRSLVIGEIKPDERIDLGLFTAFVTVLLEFARSRFADDLVVISFGEQDGEMYVQMDFKFDGVSPCNEREVLLLRGISDKKRVNFIAFEENDIFTVRFSPVIYDWSLLGVKTPDDNELVFELT